MAQGVLESKDDSRSDLTGAIVIANTASPSPCGQEFKRRSSTMRVFMLMAASVSIGLLGACDNSAKSGTLIGAGGGALAGQAIGGNTEGTLIGAGIGALGGYIVGSEMDKDRERKQAQQQANNPVNQSNAESQRLRAENERLRLQAENERLRRELEAGRDD